MSENSHVTARNRPRGRKTTDIGTVRRTAQNLHARGLVYRAIAAEMGISGGMAYRLINDPGYEPHEAHYREILNLPVMIPAPACSRCGDVHVSKRCATMISGRKTPRRVAIRCDDMKSAAATILRNLEPDKALELAAILIAEQGYNDVKATARAVMDKSEIDVVAGLADIFSVELGE